VSAVLQHDARFSHPEDSPAKHPPAWESEDVEARTTAHLVHKTIHKAFTNHNKVLANTISNVLKKVFFGALGGTIIFQWL
jgi:hypothetical protein